MAVLDWVDRQAREGGVELGRLRVREFFGGQREGSHFGLKKGERQWFERERSGSTTPGDGGGVRVRREKQGKAQQEPTAPGLSWYPEADDTT